MSDQYFLFTKEPLNPFKQPWFPLSPGGRLLGLPVVLPGRTVPPGLLVDDCGAGVGTV